MPQVSSPNTPGQAPARPPPPVAAPRRSQMNKAAFECCTSVFSCVSCLLGIFIAVSDILLLVYAVLTYQLYLPFWTIVKGKMTAVPLMFISLATVRMFAGLVQACCCSSKEDDDSQQGKCCTSLNAAGLIVQLVGGIMAVVIITELDDVMPKLTDLNVTRADLQYYNTWLAVLGIGVPVCGMVWVIATYLFLKQLRGSIESTYGRPRADVMWS